MAAYEKPKRDVVDYELASIGTRFIALIIDSIILGVITGVLFWGGREAGGLAGFIVGIVYQWYFLTQQNGQTPGKKWLGIRVVKASGAPLEAADVIVRYVGYYINSVVFMLGWIWAMFDGKSQGWHDKLAGTYVVKA
ncbi:MAG: RDD family protein [Anaerolineae bacterium]